MRRLILLVDVVTLLYTAFSNVYLVKNIFLVRGAYVGVDGRPYIQDLESWEGHDDRFDDRSSEDVVGDSHLLDMRVDARVTSEGDRSMYAYLLHCVLETGEQENRVPSSSVHDRAIVIQLALERQVQRNR